MSLPFSTVSPSFTSKLRAVNDRILLTFATLSIEDREFTVSVHDGEVAFFVLHGDDVVELDGTLGLRFERGLFSASGSRTTDVERTHRELSARFTDGLSGDDADRFTDVDHASASKVAAVAETADALLALAGEHGADANAVDTGFVDRLDEIFGDFVVRPERGLRC